MSNNVMVPATDAAGQGAGGALRLHEAGAPGHRRPVVPPTEDGGRGTWQAVVRRGRGGHAPQPERLFRPVRRHLPVGRRAPALAHPPPAIGTKQTAANAVVTTATGTFLADPYKDAIGEVTGEVGHAIGQSVTCSTESPGNMRRKFPAKH